MTDSKKIYTVFCNQCNINKDVFMNRILAENKCTELNIKDKQKLFIEANKDLVISKLIDSPIYVMLAPFFKTELDSFPYTSRYSVFENTIV
jgi:hypothetical protein